MRNACRLSSPVAKMSLAACLTACACGCASTSTRWQRASQTDTIAAYREFLEHTRRGPYADKARASLEELEFFASFESDPSVDARIMFAAKYPASPRAQIARDDVAKRLRAVRAAGIKKLSCVMLSSEFAFPRGPNGVMGSRRTWKTTQRDDEIRGIIAQALKPVGVTLTTNGLETVDAELSVLSELQCIPALYGSTARPVEVAAAGARLNGAILLKLPDGTSYVRGIASFIGPPNTVTPASANAVPEILAMGFGGAISNLVKDVFEGRDPLTQTAR